jgi:Uma2 family endonuclease
MVLRNPLHPKPQAPLQAQERSPLQVQSRSPESAWPDGPPPCNLYSDEPPLETDLHRRQIDLLIRLLEYWWRERDNFYISGNLTVYYSPEQTKKRDFRGPDVFVVLDTEKRDRRSWAIWEENDRYPNLVIELLSTSTATVDRTTKKELYQTVWSLPEYYWFDPESLEFEGFRLMDGVYEAIAPDASGHLSSRELGLSLGIHERDLRWFTPEGELIPFPEEAEQQAKEEALQAQQQERIAKEQALQAQQQERIAKEQALQAQQQERIAKEQALQAQQQERIAKEQALQDKEQERIAKEQALQDKEQALQAQQRLEAYLRSQGLDPDNLP